MSILNPRLAPASNPCIGTCSHATGDDYCRGCGRSIIEALEWNTYSAEQKIAIKAHLPDRVAQVKAGKAVVC